MSSPKDPCRAAPLVFLYRLPPSQTATNCSHSPLQARAREKFTEAMLAEAEQYYFGAYCRQGLLIRTAPFYGIVLLLYTRTPMTCTALSDSG